MDSNSLPSSGETAVVEVALPVAGGFGRVGVGELGEPRGFEVVCPFQLQAPAGALHVEVAALSLRCQEVGTDAENSPLRPQP